jgi:hypothetical protein
MPSERKAKQSGSRTERLRRKLGDKPISFALAIPKDLDRVTHRHLVAGTKDNAG